METQVTAKTWREMLALAESGRSVVIPPKDRSPEACLIRGYLLLVSRPEEAKELLAAAQKSSDIDLANVASVYEARAYEYLGQCDEGRILIRSILERTNLSDGVRALGLLVLSIFQSSGRALSTLLEIDVEGLCPGLKARICTRRGRLYVEERQYDKALIEYAGAAFYYEEAGDRKGTAHAHNNLAGVLRRQGKYAEAHASIDKALLIVGDKDCFTANFLDHRARVFLEDRRFVDAEVAAKRAVTMVDDGKRPAVLCENLCTLGRALLGQGKYVEGSEALARAKSIAQALDSNELLFMVEGARRRCAEEVIRTADLQMAELALRVCDGSYRAAAKMMGLTHPGIIKLLRRNNFQWKPKRPQSIISKSLK